MFCCITLVLLTSGSFEKKPGNVLYRNSLTETLHDTTGLIHFMKVDTFKLIVFPPSSGIQFYRNGIVFLSPSKSEGKMLPKYISFGKNEAYYVIPMDSISGKHNIFSPSFPFSYPCEAITFTSDFTTMYFTKIPDKGKKEKIYLARFTSDGKKQYGWLSETAPVNFCSDNATYTHPSLSSDEKFLVFASDKEGSLGGMDLFLTRKDGDKWSVPVNLGNLINTPGNEFFPFIDSENNLFFSSDGLPGYGGYDIFTCKFNGVTWDKPLNLSRHINSEKDDIAFTINKLDGKTAFFTQREKSGTDVMQLYKVVLDNENPKSKMLTISNLFHGNPVTKSSPASTLTVPIARNAAQDHNAKKEPANETIKKNTEKKSQQKKVLSEVKKEEVKVSETTAGQKTLPVKKPVTEPETNVISKKPVSSVASDTKGEVTYRVQFSSGSKSQETKLINVNGKSYTTYQYLYLKEYRTTIGEFSSLKPAVELQNALRQSGHKEAFVVAFINNVRSTDPALFK